MWWAVLAAPAVWRGQFILQTSLFYLLQIITIQKFAIANTTEILIRITIWWAAADVSRAVCFLHMFGCPLHLSESNMSRNTRRSVVRGVWGWGFVGLVASWVGAVGRWSVMEWWLVLADLKDEKFEGSCVEIPKMSTGCCSESSDVKLLCCRFLLDSRDRQNYVNHVIIIQIGQHSHQFVTWALFLHDFWASISRFQVGS
jgi:hypothetical protein